MYLLSVFFMSNNSVFAGTVTLTKNFSVCQEGVKLSVDQARILKFMGEELSSFKVNLLASWNKESGFRKL